MTIDADIDDVQALLSEVESFAMQRIAIATERPETPITDQTLAVLSLEAAELGLIPDDTAGGGFALWEHSDHAAAMAFNVGLLRHIGYANAGVAFAWHRAALARWLMTTVGVEFPLQGPLGIAMATTGHYGLAQNRLGKFLVGHDAEADHAVLSDWLDRHGHATTLVMPASWDAIVWPVWHGGEIRWELARRENLKIERLRAQHGFDELTSFHVQQFSQTREGILASPSDSRQLFERALKLDMIGLMAIAAGAHRRARHFATEYASVRKQGGKLIACHPAVQQMLGEIETVGHQLASMLHGLFRPLDDITLAEVSGLRAVAHVALCHAANQVVQVHGGIGYMRDAGPEKIVRDQNMLRLQSGGLREIPLLLAGLNGGRA